MYAPIAGKRSEPQTDTTRIVTDSVPINAKAHGEGKRVMTTFSASALTVVMISRSINTQNKFIAQASVQEARGGSMRVKSVVYLGKADVYNMEVEDTHNYVANGFISHNCDEARYFFMSRPITPIVKTEAAPILFDPLDQYKVKPYRRV
jgi:hypothetical protein